MIKREASEGQVVVARDGDPRFCFGAGPLGMRPEAALSNAKSWPRSGALVLLMVAFTLACVAPLRAAQSGQAAKTTEDVLLRSMQAELERSKAQIKMAGADAPYYIEYRAADIQEFEARAAFGALVAENRVHVRFIRAVVRVGDYKDDSYFGQGQGVADYMGLDDDPLALKHQLWLVTDRAYKDAIEALAAKRAALKRFKIDQPVDDFSHLPAVQSIGPLVQLNVDTQVWRKAIMDASALYRKDPEVQSLEAYASFSALNDYFINSEGAVIRQGRTLYRLGVNSFTQAADGMFLGRSPAFSSSRIDALLTPTQFIARTEEALDSLKQLRGAPIVEEEYRGPVLFVPDAANDVIAALVGKNILGNRPQPGASARTTGEYASSYKSRVLPEFISVTDDPTQSDFSGHSLIGSYEFDDEGVKAQPVKVIEKGVLVNYLLGRQPIRDLPNSNGHGRAAPAGPPVPAMGNLTLTGSQTLSRDELKKKMIELCRQQGKPYGYLVRTMGGLVNPLLIYRVGTQDGHEELVRGAVFKELDTRALRNNLIAVGNDAELSNTANAIPFSVISPSLLFDELEVKRTEIGKEKLPEYPAPALGANVAK